MSLFVLPRLDTSFLAEERMGRNFAFRGGWCLGGGGGARCSNLHIGRAKLPAPAFAARKHGCWGERLSVASLQRGEPSRLWRCDSCSLYLRPGAGLGLVDRGRATRFACGCHQRPGRANGLGLDQRLLPAISKPSVCQADVG